MDMHADVSKWFITHLPPLFIRVVSDLHPITGTRGDKTREKMKKKRRMKGKVIEVERKRGWGDGEEGGVREWERQARKEGKKELSVSTKDNIIKLPQKAVVPTVTKLWRLRCGWVFVCSWHQSHEVYDSVESAVVQGWTWSAANMACMPMMLPVFHVTFLHTHTHHVPSVPDTQGETAVPIALLYVASPGCLLSLLPYMIIHEKCRHIQ